MVRTAVSSSSAAASWVRPSLTSVARKVSGVISGPRKHDAITCLALVVLTAHDIGLLGFADFASGKVIFEGHFGGFAGLVAAVDEVHFRSPLLMPLCTDILPPRQYVLLTPRDIFFGQTVSPDWGI